MPQRRSKNSSRKSTKRNAPRTFTERTSFTALGILGTGTSKTFDITLAKLGLQSESTIRPGRIKSVSAEIIAFNSNASGGFINVALNGNNSSDFQTSVISKTKIISDQFTTRLSLKAGPEADFFTSIASTMPLIRFRYTGSDPGKISITGTVNIQWRLEEFPVSMS